MSISMSVADFNYLYPEDLVATEPRANYRTALFSPKTGAPQEITTPEIFDRFRSGDVLVINDTQVLPRRITSLTGLEILFLNQLGANDAAEHLWQVLFPARAVKDTEDIPLPGGVTARLHSRGLPQTLKISAPLDEAYFNQWAELALPPYIQKARGERHNREQERQWYQTAWATHPGSTAAPTASLHFSISDIEALKSRGVQVVPLTLHVGIGTFLPIKTENLEDHKMHGEWAHIPCATVQSITAAKASGRRVWALGTTATRALESWGHGLLQENERGDFAGTTDLFIRPGFRFEVVDVLMTNFHQPGSTLLALVSAFAGRENVLSTYSWAIEKRFRLFSYGDLSIWEK